MRHLQIDTSRVGSGEDWPKLHEIFKSDPKQCRGFRDITLGRWFNSVHLGLYINKGNRRLVAAAVLELGGPKLLVVNLFATHAKCRGKGHGRDLFAAIQDAAKSLGFAEVVICSTKTAKGFWKKLGCRPALPGNKDFSGRYDTVRQLPGSVLMRWLVPKRIRRRKQTKSALRAKTKVIKRPAMQKR